MGYITTVLGYGANHMNLPINLLFKKVIKYNDECAPEYKHEEVIPLSEIDDLESLVLKNPVQVTLQDDIIDPTNPEMRDFIIETEDDAYDLLSDSFKSKEYGYLIGRAGPCFSGIIITESKSDTDCDIEENILGVKKWVSELRSQGRFPQEAKLVMVDNCCS